MKTNKASIKKGNPQILKKFISKQALRQAEQNLVQHEQFMFPQTQTNKT